MTELNANERIIRAKIKMQKESPFFSFLIMHLKFIDVDTLDKNHPVRQIMKQASHRTMGVDNQGNVFYDPEFVKGLTDETLHGVLVHELLHCALNHLDRTKQRDPNLSNICQDLCINDIILENHFDLPEHSLRPENHTFTFKLRGGKKYIVKDINKKSFEQIYDELYDKLPKQEVIIYSDKGFDEHIPNGKDKGDGKTDKANKVMADKWKEKLIEAQTFAKMRNKLPLGMDRLIGEILESKVDWKQLLYRYITNYCISDYSYMRPHRRSSSLGYYMPHMVRENINILTAIDTSGSIGQEELTTFVSEIIGIAKSFHNIKITVLECDAEINQTLEVSNGDIPKLMDMKVKGGGGTSFEPPLSWIKENQPNTKLLIYFTDGFGDIPKNDTNANILWVITKGGSDEVPKKIGGEIIKL